MPNTLRRRVCSAGEHGRLQRLLAVLAGAVVRLLSGLAAVGSGWFLPGPGVLVGAGVGVLAALVLLRARSALRP